jgi:hypothetical protein
MMKEVPASNAAEALALLLVVWQFIIASSFVVI